MDLKKGSPPWPVTTDNSGLTDTVDLLNDKVTDIITDKIKLTDTVDGLNKWIATVTSDHSDLKNAS